MTAMKPFRVHKGRVVPLDRVNVDTDQIIPKQFLKRVERTGFGEFLFFDWRRARDGNGDTPFVLDHPRDTEMKKRIAERSTLRLALQYCAVHQVADVEEGAT